MDDESIFAVALALTSADERQAYLERACGSDAALRGKVEELLRADADAGSFIVRPALEGRRTLHEEESDTTPDDLDGAVHVCDLLEPCATPGRIGKLGSYEIIEVVGSGGMGTVLRGIDVKLRRVVAVKVMSPQLAASAMAVKRFLREAQSAAAVHHDHVVTVHAVEDQHRPPFLVMEFVQGRTLQQKIEQDGDLPLPQILRIGAQMAAGLAAAHKQGLIHRDVKPANILLENGVERVKITDFGLARAAHDAAMTVTGVVAGTPQYMSPEQAKGEPVDCRSDLFSLGSVLYTMCTGRPAFRAETTIAVLRRVCDDSPAPLETVNPQIPKWLAAMVMRLLEKDPAARFQSADEVANLLEQCGAHVQNAALHPLPKQIANSPRTKRKSFRKLAWLSAAVVVFVAGMMSFENRGRSAVLALFGYPHLAGPVLLLNFDEDDFYQKDGKTYVRDRSGRGNDGLCEQVRYTYQGKTGGGLANEGNGFLRLESSLVEGQSNFTIAAWVKPNYNDLASVYGVNVASYPSIDAPRFNLFSQPGPSLFATICNIAPRAGNVIPTNAWMEQTVSYDREVLPETWMFMAIALEEGGPGSGQLRMMLNDRLWERSSQKIGRDETVMQDIIAKGLDGFLDEVTVWHRALTEAELRELFTRGQATQSPRKPYPTSDPALVLHFGEDDFYERDGKTYVRDRSGQANDGLCEGVRFTRDGQTGGGLANDGKGFLRLDSSLIAGEPNFTIAGWVKPGMDNFPALYSVNGKNYPSLDTPRFALCPQPGPHLFATAWNSNFNDIWVGETVRYQRDALPDAWIFIAISLKDGGPGNGTACMMLNDQVWKKTLQKIGRDDFPIQDFIGVGLKGELDEITVWHRTLAEDELQEVFARGQAEGARKPPAIPVPSSTSGPYDTAISRAKRLAIGGRASWSSDSKRLLYANDPGLRLFDSQTGETKTISDTGRDAAYSPTDERLAYVDGSGATAQIWLMDIDGQNQQMVAPGSFPTWSADGKSLYFHSPADGMVRKVYLNASKSSIHDLASVKPRYPAVSPDGKWLAYVELDHLVVRDLKTGEKREHVFGKGNGGLVSWSPDSRHVGFSGYGQGDVRGLWVFDVDSGSVAPMATGGRALPAWSPDGKRLAFDLREPSMERGIWIAELEPIPHRPAEADE